MTLTRIYPAYTTVDAVVAELPPRFREDDLPRTVIQAKIDGQANLIDGYLTRYYRLPARPLAPVLGDGPLDPATGEPLRFVPGQLEMINRYLAATECLVVLRDLRGDEKAASPLADTAAKTLEQITQGQVILTYPFLHADGRPYFVPLADGSPLYGTHPLSARQRVQYRFPERTFTRETTKNWGPG